METKLLFSLFKTHKTFHFFNCLKCNVPTCFYYDSVRTDHNQLLISPFRGRPTYDHCWVMSWDNSNANSHWRWPTAYWSIWSDHLSATVRGKHCQISQFPYPAQGSWGKSRSWGESQLHTPCVISPRLLLKTDFRRSPSDLLLQWVLWRKWEDARSVQLRFSPWPVPPCIVAIGLGP